MQTDEFQRSQFHETSPFSLNIAKKRATVIFTPALIQDIMGKYGTSFDPQTPILHILVNAFAYPLRSNSSANGTSVSPVPELPPEMQDEILSRVSRDVEYNVPDFVSFMSNLIDQATWERGTIIAVDKDDDSAIVSFHEIIFNFTSQMILNTVIHPNDLTNHPHAATFIHDLRSMLSSFMFLVLGMPRWLPMPRLTSAHVARYRLLSTLSSLFRALDEVKAGRDLPPDSDWAELADLAVEDSGQISPLLRIMQDQKGDASPEARASLTLALVLMLSSRVSNLVFWTLAHVEGDNKRPLASSSNEESFSRELSWDNQQKDLVRVVQPDSLFRGVVEPPRLTVNENKLRAMPDCGTNGKSLLECSYLESVRVHGRSVGVALVAEDVDLSATSSKEKDARKQKSSDVSESKSRAVKLKMGEYVLLPSHLHNSSPAAWMSPNTWIPERHRTSWDAAADGEGRSENEVMNDIGFDSVLAGGEDLVRRLCMVFVAGFHAVWEVELLDRVEDIRTAQRLGIVVAEPKGVVKARIKRRRIVGQAHI